MSWLSLMYRLSSTSASTLACDLRACRVLQIHGMQLLSEQPSVEGVQWQAHSQQVRGLTEWSIGVSWNLGPWDGACSITLLSLHSLTQHALSQWSAA